MSNDLYYDLSAAVNLQNNYVNDLSSIYNKNTDNAADIAVQLNNLQSVITQLSSQYDAANSSSDSVLHHQQEMMNILQVEQQRLLAKKALFDQVEAENDRKVLLNTTYRKKYTQYTKITIVVIMVLIAIVIIRLMGKYITVFPESLYSFLMIVVISIGIIYVLILYADLSARSNIDYDSIEIPPPKLDASGNLVVNSPAGPSIWGMFDTCKGSKCCSIGTNWNDQLSLCVVQPYNQGSGLAGSAATIKPSTTTASKATAFSTTPSTTTASKATAFSTTPSTTTASSTTPSKTTASTTSTTPSTTTASKATPSATTASTTSTTPSTTTASKATPSTTTASATTASATTASATTASATTASATTASATTASATTASATTASATTASATTPSATTASATTPSATTASSTTPSTTTASSTTPSTTTASSTTASSTTPSTTTASSTTASSTTPSTTTASSTTPSTTTASSTTKANFTTMAQAVAYGDINQSTKILPSSMQITSAWMGDTSMAKPSAYLEYNKFQKI